MCGRVNWNVDDPTAGGLQPVVKRRLFFLALYGVTPDEPSTILKVTQDTTVAKAIEQALRKANKPNENVYDYVILEEVSRGWNIKSTDRSAITQRILEPNEKLVNAQNSWRGEGRFILKKLADDPSTRAWMTSIRASSANKERRKGASLANEGATGTSNDTQASSDVGADWDEEPENETFLVCIYNVNDDQPYTILKTAITASAQDVIAQALHKAHRTENPACFVLVEEVENFCETGQTDGPASSSSSPSFSFNKSSKAGIGYRRVVADDENIYEVQKKWKNKGKFELKYRKDISAADSTQLKSTVPTPRLLLRNRGSFKKLSQIHRTYSRRLIRKDKESNESSPAHRNRSAAHDTGCESPQSARACTSSKSNTPIKQTSEEARHTHSEGEMPSDSEEIKKASSQRSSFSRFKRLSLKRLKVWKS